MDGMIKPVAFDKKGPMFSESDVQKYVIEETVGNNSYARRVSVSTSEKITEATEILNQSLKTFDVAHTKMQEKSKHIQEQAKKTSGDVRDAANKLAEGLLRIEKSADFNRLERYAELLERCASAMTTLAELEQSGKLNKIAQSLK